MNRHEIKRTIEKKTFNLSQSPQNVKKCFNIFAVLHKKYKETGLMYEIQNTQLYIKTSLDFFTKEKYYIKKVQIVNIPQTNVCKSKKSDNSLGNIC